MALIADDPHGCAGWISLDRGKHWHGDNQPAKSVGNGDPSVAVQPANGGVITPVYASYSTSNGGTSHAAVCKITPCVAQQYYYYEVSSTLCVAAQSAVTSSTRFKVTACLDP